MLYLLALIGAVTLFAAVWALLSSSLNPFPPTRRRALAPDDDPEFLRRLGERRPRPPES
ncbi:MAG TPA: hypothetical protein VGJ95_20940 [Pseudonocardiaceae bacterium]